jgi:hypothetical protein
MGLIWCWYCGVGESEDSSTGTSRLRDSSGVCTCSREMWGKRRKKSMVMIVKREKKRKTMGEEGWAGHDDDIPDGDWVMCSSDDMQLATLSDKARGVLAACSLSLSFTANFRAVRPLN